MTAAIEVQEVAFVIAAKKHNPSLINPDFLKCSGILQEDAELVRQPIFTAQAAQLVFNNGISVTAQGERVIFAETLGKKPLQDLALPQVTHKYIQVLPHADYQMMGINLRGILPFQQNADAARQFMASKLLAPGTWQNFGQEPVRTSINVAYTLEGKRLYLSISEAAIQQPEGETTPILMFSGSFEYPIEGNLQKLLMTIDNWQVDLNLYKDLINHRFLHHTSLPIMSSNTEPELIPVGV